MPPSKLNELLGAFFKNAKAYMNPFSVADSSKGRLLLRVNVDTVAGKKLNAKWRHLLFLCQSYSFYFTKDPFMV